MEYTTALSETETQRYSRQIILKEIGLENHKKISNTVVLVVGLGGLGSPVVTYLCTSGIKKIILADFDKVELHNLQRQTIHQENFINNYKTESAKHFINNLNSEMEVKCFTKKVNKENIEEIAKEANLLVDCTDDLNTRYIISAYAKKFRKTLIMGSVLKFAGQVYVFPKGKSCYTCVFPEFKTVRENCSSAGVLGSVCGIIGSIQATEIIKNILIDYPSYILTYDAIDNEIKKVIVRECKEMCEKINLPNQNQNQEEDNFPEKNLITWNEVLKDGDKYLLIDVRDTKSYDMCHFKNSVNLTKEGIQNYETNKIKVIVCRKGISAKKIWYELNDESILVMKGGLTAYKNEIDNKFTIF